MLYTGSVRRWLAAVAACAALSLAPGAQAVVIDFGEGPYNFVTVGGAAYQEDGFRFTASDNQANGITDPLAQGVGHFDLYDPDTYPAFGTDRVADVHTGNNGDSVTVDAFGAPFDLIALGVLLFDQPGSGVWQVVASNGATSTITGIGTVVFDSSWLNITSFTIRSTSAPSQEDNSGNLEFDNIEVSPVPEPSVGLLAVAALAGVLLARRGGLAL